jgi:hypothetical protein
VWELLVVALLLWPTAPDVPHRAPEPLWQALKQVALVTEVVGPHERWANDFRAELSYVRRHFRELQDAPPLEDCGRLPPLEVTTAYCRLNWSYQEGLKARRWVCRYRWEELTQALDEAQCLYQVWETVREANCADRSWACRRRALSRLRETLGSPAFYRGELPPCLPVWRFPEAD